MNLSLLALTTRSLREDARSWWTHSMRGLLVLVLLLAIAMVNMQSLFIGAPGLYLLTPMLYIDLVFIALLGVGVFATVITEEKEEMSLGLLKMTGMSPLSILLGKSFGALILAALLLAVQLPFTFLAMAMGGVSADQIFAAYVLLIAYTLFIYSAGLLCSVLCLRSSSASGLLVVLLASLNMLPYFVPAIVTELVQAGREIGAESWLAQLTRAAEQTRPLLPFQAMYGVLMGFDGTIIGPPAIAHLIAAVVAFLLAWAIFNRATLQEKPSAPERPAVRRADPRKFRSGRAWSRFPIFWKDYRFFAGGWPSLLFTFVAYGALVALVALLSYKSNNDRWDPEEFTPAVFIALVYALVFHSGVVATRTLSYEVKWKTLSALALLPGGMGRAAYAKLAAGLLQLVPGLAWIAITAGFGPLYYEQTYPANYDPPNLVIYNWSQLLFFLHLAVYLSVLVRRGPLAMTIGLWMGGNVLFQLIYQLLVTRLHPALPGNTGVMEFTYNTVGVLLLIACVVMHPLTGQRLRVLAAE